MRKPWSSKAWGGVRGEGRRRGVLWQPKTGGPGRRLVWPSWCGHLSWPINPLGFGPKPEKSHIFCGALAQQSIAAHMFKNRPLSPGRELLFLYTNPGTLSQPQNQGHPLPSSFLSPHSLTLSHPLHRLALRTQLRSSLSFPLPTASHSR